MNWFYARDGQQHGPHTEAELRALLGQLRLSPTDLVWREGLPGWLPVQQALATTSPSPAHAMPPPMPSPAAQYQPPPAANYQQANYQQVDYAGMPKSRAAYVLLGIFLGGLGVHNFYAGFVGRGIAQLLISVLSLGFLVWVVWIWNLIEIITVTHDSRNVRMN